MPKRIHTPKIYSMRDIYKDYAEKLLRENPTWWLRYDYKKRTAKGFIYAKENDKVVLKMSWAMFKEIISSFYHKAKDAIIQGETLRMGSGLGKIRAIRIERNFNNPAIDFGETYKLPPNPDGTRKLVYYTNDDYIRIQWRKSQSIRNEQMYLFTPANKNTKSGKGFKIELVNALNKDPMLRYNYKFYPLKYKKVCNTPTLLLEESLDR